MRVSFCHTRNWTGYIGISSPVFYHCIMVTSGFHIWQFHKFILWCRMIGGGIVLIRPVRFSFCYTRNWTGNLCISSLALYHCAMVTSGFQLWQFQVFNSSAEGLVVVFLWLKLWQFLFYPTGNWSGGIWLSSLQLYHCAMVNSGFQLWQLQVFDSSAEGLMVVFLWWTCWSFFLPHCEWNW